MRAISVVVPLLYRSAVALISFQAVSGENRFCLPECYFPSLTAAILALYHATQFYQWFENRGMDVTCGLSLMGTHGLMDGNGGTTDPDPTVDIASLPFTWTNRYFKMLTQGTHRLMDDATKLPPLGVVLPEPVPGQPVTSYFTADTILPIVGAQRQLEDGDDHEHHRKLVTNGAEGIVGVKWIDKDYNALGQSLFPFVSLPQFLVMLCAGEATATLMRLAVASRPFTVPQ
jgi:hypothetical protein